MAFTVILLPNMSPQVGLGHFYRCLRLGIAIRAAGYRPIMVGARFSPMQRKLLRKYGISSELLSGVGVKGVISFLRESEEKPSWIVTDHYRLAQSWEQAIKPYVGHIAVFDDADGRTHDCDLLINGALSSRKGRSWYRNRVSRLTTLLLGPQYALPDPQLKAVRRTAREHSAAQTICFFLGGSAPWGVYRRYVDSLLKELPASIERIICILPKVRKPGTKLACDRRISVVTDYSKLKAALEKSELFVGSGGAVSYDRICVGLPGLVVSVAENQIELCRYLAKLGTQVYLGDYQSVPPRILAQNVARLVTDIGLLESMRSKCEGVVDGRGAERIVKALRAHTKLG